MKFIRIAVISTYLFVGLVSAVSAQQPEKTKLTVLLYPWVPDYAHIAKVMEEKFEAENSGVDLVISEQNWNYYEPGGLDPVYDVYELDGIFLSDFVKAGRLQTINGTETQIRKDVIKAAADATKVDGAIYAVPHWSCALFTFFFMHDTRLAAANTRTDLISVIGSTHERGRGLLVDWKGHITLTELYADSLLDLGVSPEDTVKALSNEHLNPNAKSALSDLIALSDVGSGRSEVAHKAWPPYYALEFAHGRGRALVGYSERMHHILQEITKPTDPTPVVDPRTISVKLFNQGDKSGVPLLWVDSFAIDKSVTGPKLTAAQQFIEFAVRDDQYLSVLLPPDKAPQYLLPAYRNLYTDTKLVEAAPLYPKFLVGLDKAASLVGVGIPQAIEKTGEQLDKKLPTNLHYPN